MLPFAQASAHGVHSLSAVDAMKLLTHSKATLLRPLAGAFLAAALAGCTTLAPDYQRPAAPVAAQWPTPTTAGAPSSAAADLQAIYNHRLAQRSEEHTSELQSLMRISYAVFRLKKKKT